MFDRLARQIGVLLRQQRPHDLRRHTLAHPAIARCTRPARGPNVMLMSSQQHALDYIEFPVADLAVAREFYGTVFGWRFNDYGPAYAGIIAADGQGEVGGLDATATPTPGGPLVLIRSADLAASAAAVAQAGGAIVAGPYDYPGGRRFEFTDPSGLRLGVYQPQA